MITKAIVQSINSTGDRCMVRIPLFESAGNNSIVETTALVNITPGVYNGLTAGDIVFIGFEENAIERPIILGKLFRGGQFEASTRGGGGNFNSLKVNSDATLPATTLFKYSTGNQDVYKNFTTPKDIADYILWLERLTKNSRKQLDDNFRCFKNWTQWQFKAENVEIDDGDLDVGPSTTPFLYQNEHEQCDVCGENCSKKLRSYPEVLLDKTYPNN